MLAYLEFRVGILGTLGGIGILLIMLGFVIGVYVYIGIGTAES
jgi:hypothetical protein